MKSLLYLSFLALFLFSCGEGEQREPEKSIKIQQTQSAVAEKKPKPKLSKGEKAFILCAACHNLKKGEPNKTGPNLHGIFGRKAASLESFTYSEALKNSDIVWSEEHIKNWLTKPADYVPGTTMAFVGIKNEEQQDALIKYLKEQTK